MATENSQGAVPPIEPTPPVAPPVPPAAAQPAVAPPVPTVDPYASGQPQPAQPAGTVPLAAYPSAPQPGYPPQGNGQPGYAQPGQYPPGQYPPGYYYPVQPQGPRGLSITSMVLGIVGVVFGLFYGLGLFPSIAGVITGHIALKRQPAGRGFAIAGLICGYAGILGSLVGIGILVFVIVIATQSGAFTEFNDYSDFFSFGAI